MPAITIKNIPAALYDQLKTSAHAHHRSINSELIHCLETALMPRPASPRERLAAAQALRQRVRAERIDADDIQAAKEQGRT